MTRTFGGTGQHDPRIAWAAGDPTLLDPDIGHTGGLECTVCRQSRKARLALIPDQPDRVLVPVDRPAFTEPEEVTA